MHHKYLRNLSDEVFFGFIKLVNGNTQLDYFKRTDESVEIICSKYTTSLRGVERKSYKYNFTETENEYIVLYKEGYQNNREISDLFDKYIAEKTNKKESIEFEV